MFISLASNFGRFIFLLSFFLLSWWVLLHTVRWCFLSLSAAFRWAFGGRLSSQCIAQWVYTRYANLIVILFPSVVCIFVPLPSSRDQGEIFCVCIIRLKSECCWRVLTVLVKQMKQHLCVIVTIKTFLFPKPVVLGLIAPLLLNVFSLLSALTPMHPHVVLPDSMPASELPLLPLLIIVNLVFYRTRTKRQERATSIPLLPPLRSLRRWERCRQPSLYVKAFLAVDAYNSRG